ncbi:hypothetical protein WMY93_030747 [Mugilogobius chulae]|uniref:Polycystin cation channel PKD1/PKD2 domain-containing protein n=1 Tax=Mugilogobius chulae TaxID=88201 RepID=A0AAW0MMJ9_9GOBI
MSNSNYAVTVCKILFLIVLFVRLWDHILFLSEKGLLRYSKVPHNWLEVGVFIVATVYYIYGTYRTVLVSEVAELLQRQNSKTHIDFSQLASWDQTIRSLRGTLLFLLTLRCAILINKTTLSTRPSVASLDFGCSFTLCGCFVVCSKTSQCSKLLDHNVFFTKAKNKKMTLYQGIFFLLSRLMWTTLKKDIFTTADLIQYIKKKLFSFWTRSMYYFEQFESVLDELLFKLDVLSEDDCPISTRQSSSERDTEDFLEYEITQPLTLLCTETSAGELRYLPSKGRKGHEITEGIALSNEELPDEMTCRKNTEEKEVKASEEQFTLTSYPDKSSEMVVEVLVHKELELY